MFERIAMGIDRRPVLTLSAFSVVLVAMTIVRASAKAFTHDEILTVVTASLPTVRSLWTAYLDAADLGPPLNSLITHAIAAMFGFGRISTRLPAMVGYWTMTVFIFHIVQRRSNTPVALSAVLLPYFSGAAEYAYEARGYGLMLGMFALALYSWSEAARGHGRRWHTPLMAFALAGGVWAHYYAVLAFVPLLIGESVRFARTRQPDWGMCAALAAAALASLPLVPLIRVVAGHAVGYWAPARGIGQGWSETAASLGGLLLGRRALLLFALVAAAGCAERIVARRALPGPSGRSLPAHEIAAGIASVLIPFWGMLLSVWVTGVFIPRYVLLGVVGIAIVVPLVVWSVFPTRIATTLLCLGLTAAFSYSAFDALYLARPQFKDPLKDRPLLTAKLAGPSAVFVSDSLFLEMWYYAPPELRLHLGYAADPVSALRLSGSDDADRSSIALSRWSAIDVESVDTMLSAHHTFRVYVAGPRHWQVANLRARGARLRELGHELGYWLFEVEMPGRSAT